MLFAAFGLVATFLAVWLLGATESVAAMFGGRIVVYQLVLPVGLLAAHFFTIARLEGDDWRMVGLDSEAALPRRWAWPAAIAAGAIVLPSLLLLAGGWLAPVQGTGGSWTAATIRALILILPASLGEELLVRGYLFAMLREAWGWRWAVLVSSVAFGALHSANPGVSAFALANVVLAGVFLGLVLVRTGSLYAAWAAHAAWNVALVVGLHADVSGVTLGEMPRYRIVDSGPDWLSGGLWGPEGGAGAALGLLLATILVGRPLIPARRRSNG